MVSTRGNLVLQQPIGDHPLSVQTMAPLISQSRDHQLKGVIPFFAPHTPSSSTSSVSFSHIWSPLQDRKGEVAGSGGQPQSRSISKPESTKSSTAAASSSAALGSQRSTSVDPPSSGRRGRLRTRAVNELECTVDDAAQARHRPCWLFVKPCRYRFARDT
jgi:hypothetical protein